MNWGSDPDVALFIGGPKDGEIESIGGTDFMMIQDAPVALYSALDPTPVHYITGQKTSYLRGKVRMGSGETVTVMFDSQLDLMTVMRRAEAEWHPNHWAYAVGGLIPSPFVNSYHYPQRWIAGIADDIKPDTRTDEEKLAWLHDDNGKEFL